jgi:hypothetical protein
MGPCASRVLGFVLVALMCVGDVVLSLHRHARIVSVGLYVLPCREKRVLSNPVQPIHTLTPHHLAGVLHSP